MFSDLCDVYEERFGLDYAHLAEISKINFGNAKNNPNAQTRKWQFSDACFTQDDKQNPIIEGWMRKQDCGQVTDGAATVILATADSAKTHCKNHGLSFQELAYIKGWGHTTAPMLMATKMEQSDTDGYVFPLTRKAITDAYRRANISGPNDLDAIETHDCFTIAELIEYEAMGLAKAGQGYRVIREGISCKDGALPINPSGGLKSKGHPIGATATKTSASVTASLR